MFKLLAIEILLMLATGLYAMWVVPSVYGYPPDVTLLVVGFLMALAFVGLYALTNLAGRKMPDKARVAIAVLAYIEAFWAVTAFVVSAYRQGAAAGDLPLLYNLLPALFGLLLTGIALWKAPRAERINTAGWALFAYAVPLLVIRTFLVPLVSGTLAEAIALQGGAVYLLLRGLVRLFAPTSAEGNAEAGPLVNRPVPDRIVGLVEGTTHRRARPFATLPDGSVDESAISILCTPKEVPAVTAQVGEALKGLPFNVESGQKADGKVEIVIRPAPAGQESQS